MAGLAPLLPTILGVGGALVAQQLTKPNLPSLPAIPALTEVPGRETSSEIAKAADQERRRRLGATGRAETVLGGAVGAPAQQKRLLGE